MAHARSPAPGIPPPAAVFALLFSAWALFRFLPRVPDPLPALRHLADLDRFGDPDPAGVLRAVGDHLRAVLAAAWVLWVQARWGRRLREAARARAPDPLVRAGLDLALGFVLFQVLWTSLGVIGLLRPPLLWALAAVFSVAPLRDLLKILRWQRRRPSSGFPPPPGALEGLAVGLAALCAAAAFWHARLPETFYDSLNYTLAAPAHWLSLGGIGDTPHHACFDLYLGGSAYLLSGLAFAGEGAAKLLAPAVSLAAALLAAGIAREAAVAAAPRRGKEIAGRRAAGCALGFLGAFGMWWTNAWAVRSDAPAAFLLLASAYALHRSLEGAHGRWGTLSAGLAGGAFAVKYTAGFGILAGLSGAAWIWIRRRRFPALSWGPFAAAALVVLPWTVKNLCFTGNPVAPYFEGLFGGRPGFEGAAALLEENRHRTGAGGLRLLEALFLPVSEGGNLSGALPFILLPVAVGALARGGAPGLWAFWGLAHLAVGLSQAQTLRFHMAGVLALVVAASVALSVEREGRLRTALTALAIVFAAGGLAGQAHVSAFYLDGLGNWLGLESRHAYLTRRMRNSYEPSADWLRRHAGDGPRILVVGDERRYGYPGVAHANSLWDAPVLAAAARVEAAGGIPVREALRRLGVWYLVVNVPEGISTAPKYGPWRLSDREWRVLDGFWRREVELLHVRDFCGVYRLKGEAEAPADPRPLSNPLLFFSPEALAYREALLRGREEEARRLLARIRELVPEDPYWKSQEIHPEMFP